MELTDLLGLGASVLSGGAGGLIGALGGLAQKWIGLVEKKRDTEREIELAKIKSAHDLAMADKRLDEIKAEAASAIQLADLHRMQETDVATLGAIGQAYAADKATYSDSNPDNRWLVATDVIRGVTRPLAFWHLLIVVDALAAFTLYHVPTTIWADPVFLKATLYQIIASILFMFNAAGCFWFVTRQPSSWKGA